MASLPVASLPGGEVTINPTGNFQSQFDTEFKKKTIKHDSKCCGI